jgi:hypothetical protein
VDESSRLESRGAWHVAGVRYFLNNETHTRRRVGDEDVMGGISGTEQERQSLEPERVSVFVRTEAFVQGSVLDNWGAMVALHADTDDDPRDFGGNRTSAPQG